MLRKKDDKEHRNLKRESLYQNQSHHVYHKFWLKQSRLKKRDVNPKRRSRYLKYQFYSVAIQVDNMVDHSFKIRIVNVKKIV